MTDTTTAPAPKWDMTPVFSSLDAPEVSEEIRGVVGAVGELGGLFERADVRRRDTPHVDQSVASAFDEVTGAVNGLRDRIRTLSGYISSFVATDSRNDLAQALQSELQNELVAFSKLATRYQAWVGSMDVDELLRLSGVAREHEFAVRQARIGASHQMSEAEEDLAATLNPTGAAAWTRLHGNVSSRLQVTVQLPGGDPQTLPMSAIRGLAHHRDRAVRRAAYDAELAAWETVAVPLAASMNGVKGTVGTLNARRGWTDSLEPALFANNVDRSTLEAMQEACVESFPDFRRYLRAKARLLGVPALGWWDIFAPVGASQRHWAFSDAETFIVEQFSTYSPRLADLAARAFRERWVDAEPRIGKRDGAFCMSLRADESRVLMNFDSSFSSVSTLAHELGHAYHNVNLAECTPIQRETPMALAETASIFCQTIVTNAMLGQADSAEQVGILEYDLQNACQIVVDIHSRFLFERSVFDGRRRRELSVAELNETMLDAQRQTYGEGLDPEGLHPFMWAVKPHYYGRSYYNWPYTFGLLFGLGLYARYREDPDGFRQGYDDLLASTGATDAATLASRFGIDVRAVEFWRSSLDQIRERIAELEALAPQGS